MRVKRFGFGATSDFNTIKSHINSVSKLNLVRLSPSSLYSLMLCGNRMCPPGRVSTYSDVQGPANQQTSFSGRDDECVAHKLFSSGHIMKKFRGPSILQLNIEGFTASKMNVLYHLATQLEAFVILLQETHCISAEKLVLSNYQLAEFSLSRKHGLATFVHERLKWTLYDQSPTTSETEWLCLDVDGCQIVNIYKPPPTRLQVSDLPVFTHPCLYAGDFNCPCCSHCNFDAYMRSYRSNEI